MIRAAVYIPSELPDDGHFAAEGCEYIEHRGYFCAGVYRQPFYIDRLLKEGVISVVVFARSTHSASIRNWPAEFVDETTRRLRWAPLLPPAVRERNGTLNWGAARVSEVLDGTGPIPSGLDPESIAAARRIALHLANCRRR